LIAIRLEGLRTSMKKKTKRRKMKFGVIVLIAATVSAAVAAVMLRAQRLHGAS
jgi:hypothetical protein